MPTRILTVCSVLLLVGCAANLSPPLFAPDHPASAQAMEAPRARASRLTADAITRATRTQLARRAAPESDYQSSDPAMMHHHMSGMEEMGAMPLKATPAANRPSEGKATSAANEDWTCVMHPEVHADKPGQCPKCGMDLIKKEIPGP